MKPHRELNSPIDPDVSSLADVLQCLKSRSDIPARRLTRVSSAVNKTAELLRQPPEQIPGHAVYLMRRLQRFGRAPEVISKAHLANTKSELRFLIKTICGRGRRSEFAPLSASWTKLKRLVAGSPLDWRLSRFFAFCASQNIAPEAVCGQTAAAFLTSLVEAGDLCDPNLKFRGTLHAWNGAVTKYAEWPQAPLTLPPKKVNRWTLIPESFPISFQTDVDSWLARLTKCDPLAEVGPRYALSPETITLRHHQIYKAASALAYRGPPVERITSLDALVQPDAFKALLRVLLDRQNGAPTEALFRLAGTLIAIARHHVGLPKDQITKLTSIAAGLSPQEKGLGKKTQERLEPFEDERILAALLRMPDQLLSEATKTKSLSRRRLLAQMAIAIELELLTTLRRKNLVRLNLQHHIQIIQKRRDVRWIIRIPPEETKNRARLTYEIPHESVEKIQRALALYDQPGGWIFPGYGDKPKDPATLGGQIKAEVEARLGVPFNLHLFRGLVASLHLKSNPNGFEAVRALLGDRNDSVIRNSYTAFAERDLIAAAQKSILDHRARTIPLQTKRAKRRARSSDAPAS